MNNQNTNPLLCDIESGTCEMPRVEAATTENTVEVKNKPLKIIYFTDPICSSCWGIEPQLRKLKLAYGHVIEIEYRMGGLLPDWGYNSGGISKPSDVAHHWDEASRYYDMPIDGDVWLEDPLTSSYPPSIAYKAAEVQDKLKAGLFLREIKEMVFLRKKNISEWRHLAAAATKVGLDMDQLKSDYEGTAKKLFKEDLELARQLGVRGFPTLFFADTHGRMEKVYGSKPYRVYEEALLKLNTEAEKKQFDKSWQSLFTKFGSLTSKEFSELAEMDRSEADHFLQELHATGKIGKLETKNGFLWTAGN